MNDLKYRVFNLCWDKVLGDVDSQPRRQVLEKVSLVSDRINFLIKSQVNQQVKKQAEEQRRRRCQE